MEPERILSVLVRCRTTEAPRACLRCDLDTPWMKWFHLVPALKPAASGTNAIT